jgi:hypothetical protein
MGHSPESHHAAHLGSPGSIFDHGVEARRSGFDRSKYRQPVLTEVATEPWPYRRGLPVDSETAAVKLHLREINRNSVSRSEKGYRASASNL